MGERGHPGPGPVLRPRGVPRVSYKEIQETLAPGTGGKTTQTFCPLQPAGDETGLGAQWVQTEDPVTVCWEPKEPTG